MSDHALATDANMFSDDCIVERAASDSCAGENLACFTDTHATYLREVLGDIFLVSSYAEVLYTDDAGFVDYHFVFDVAVSDAHPSGDSAFFCDFDIFSDDAMAIDFATCADRDSLGDGTECADMHGSVEHRAAIDASGGVDVVL